MHTSRYWLFGIVQLNYRCNFCVGQAHLFCLVVVVISKVTIMLR